MEKLCWYFFYIYLTSKKSLVECWDHVASLGIRDHREDRQFSWSTRYGTANFFPMGDKFKILFSRIGFWGTGNAMKPFTTLCARYFHQIQRIWRFSAVFTHFPSIYHYFETRNIIFATISMFWVTRNQMAKFRKLSDYQGCQLMRYINCNLLFFCGF